jgi:hypothetical protein
VTIERRLLTSLEDIELITLECLSCSSRLSIPPDLPREIPTQCPSCLKPWLPLHPAASSASASPLLNFAMSLRRLRMLIKEGVELGFRVLLEFRAPDAERRN